MKALVAKYRCLRCQFEWEQQPANPSCLKCGHRYIKWLNFDALFGGGDKTKRQ